MPNYQPKVYRKHGATELTIDAGGRLNAASGSVVFPTNLQRGFIPLLLTDARALSSAENTLGIVVSATAAATVALPSAGGLLHAFSTPRLEMISTVSNQNMVLNWTSGVVTQINWTLPAPPDYDGATGISMHIVAEKASGGATDNKFDMRAWGIGTTDLGSTQSATLTSTPTEYSVDISSAIGAHPTAWNFGLAPIAHTNFTNTVHAAWVEYPKRSS